MEKVKVVPDRVPNEVNYKIIALCIGACITFHYSAVLLGTTGGQEKNASYIIGIVFVISPLVTGIFAFVIAGFYRVSKIFGRSYILLGLGYLSSATAELIYGIQNDIIGTDPYPSIADPFYAGLNIFLIAHVVMNTSFFARTIESESGKERRYLEIRTLILFISVFCGIVFSYVAISAIQPGFQPNFEFFYGLIFVALSGITLPFLIYAAMLFKDSALGKAWHILLLAFIILIAGDVWYYHLEIFGQYDLFHPVNIFWYVGYWVQTYALFKHKRVT